MNEKFATLPKSKQNAIINAGFRVFSQNSYKKSPMGDIAEEAGISKALLFYYFKNKKELYLFLWEKVIDIISEEIERNRCYEENDLFDAMRKIMKVKLGILRNHKCLGEFAIKSKFETDQDVCREVGEYIEKDSAFKFNPNRIDLDPGQFVPGIDVDMMFRNIYWASQGYLYEAMRNDAIDVERLEMDYNKLIDFWKDTYMNKTPDDVNC